jgi:4-oxalocrotonate tautomerase
MPRVTIQLVEGRTMEQKRALVKKVTDAIVETLNASPKM